MTKAEIISWYRIFEMFRFEAFHMYGVIGSAVVLGVVVVFLIKKYRIKNTEGVEIPFYDKDKSYKRYLFGGTIFGLGWALAGACPGPMFVLLGNGYFAILLVIFGGLLGTYVYGRLKSRLPH